MKWGTWPINNNEENEIHFSITDEELQNLEEYIEFKGQIKSKEINALTSDSSAENSIDNTWSNNIK